MDQNTFEKVHTSSAPEGNSNKLKPYIVGISGGSASGKTSVSNIIFKMVGIEDCIMISLDSYYKDLTEEEHKTISEYNFDHPNAFDFDLVAEHLSDLLSGKEVQMPIYDFTTSSRQSYQTIKPGNLIIFEGILALYDKRVRNLMDMRIFVDTDDDIRLARRIYRDIKERGRNLDLVVTRYHKFVKPAFNEYIKPTRKVADVIIPRGAENTVAIDLVSKHLIYQLNKYLDTSKPGSFSANNTMTFSSHEIVDPKYQFTDGRVNLNEDPVHIEVLKQIFTDFVNNARLKYSSIFIEYLVNSLLKSYIDKNNSTENVAIVTQPKAKSFKKEKETKKIIYFQPYLLDEKDTNTLEGLLKENTVDVDILTVFLSPKLVEQLVQNYPKINLKFYSTFYSDLATKYYDIITVGGLHDDEGDFNDRACSFKDTSFIQSFNTLQRQYFNN